jgi:ring-1,2-phenylacetyl-CoA epoxidase subunit PaaB
MRPEQKEHKPVDTQWPRYQVFQQEKEGMPHQDVGSVHAPDPEMALFNARDVFVRRPECVSLWVVPVDAITFRTEQELKTQADQEPSQGQGNLETYQIFSKVKSGGTLTWAGKVEATNSEEALRKGVERFSGERSPFIWCTFPERSATANQADDIESLFTPARDKHFRLPSDFHTHSAMRKIKPARKASAEFRSQEASPAGSEQPGEC